MTSVRGLICRIALPANPQDMDWAALMKRLTPHIDGCLLDFGYWQGEAGVGAGPAPLDYLDLLLPHMPSNLLLLLHVTGFSRDRTLDTVRQFQAHCSGRPIRDRLVWVDLPLLYHSNRGLPGLYRDMRELSTQPILLENDPDRVKRLKKLGQRSNIRTQIVKSLAQSGDVVGLIHHGDLGRALNYSRAAAGAQQFKILDGNEQHFLDYPSTSGVVSTTANLLPAHWARLVAGAGKSTIRPDPMVQYESVQILRLLNAEIGDSRASEILYLLFLAGILKQAPPLDNPARAGHLQALWRDLMDSGQICTAS
jgi:hypothetical protein